MRIKFMLLYFALLFPATANADELSDCISAISNFSSQHRESAFSLDLEVRLGKATPAKIAVCWLPPDRYSLLVLEPIHGSPVAVFTEEGFLLADIVDGTLLASSKIYPKFALRATSDTVKTELLISSAKTKKPEFTLNMLSFLKGIESETQFDLGKDKAVLTYSSPSGNSTMTWNFRHERMPLLESMTIEPKEKDNATFSIKKIRTKNLVEIVDLPDCEDIDLKVKQLDQMDQVAALEGVVTRSLVAYISIFAPEHECSRTSEKSFDLAAARRNANEISELLKPHIKPKQILREPDDLAR